MSGEQKRPSNDSEAPEWEHTWKFGAYQLGSAEFTNAMLQLYRGEQERGNIWRTRLDNTTYWAIITILATVLYLFINPTHNYIVVVLDTLLVAFFLSIEARRYRYYELWSYRVRLMETDFFAAMLVPPFAPHSEWAEMLAHSLLMPEFPISMWEALGRRFRRNYLWLFFILGASVMLHAFLLPVPADSWAELVSRFGLGPIPGEIMISLGLVFNGILLLIGLVTARMQRASGEVLPKYGEFPIIGGLREALDGHEPSVSPGEGAVRGLRRRSQLLTFIVTARPQIIADRVLKEMKRGVTGLHGRGMYTQQEREVLMIAITVTEVATLEQLVRDEDPNAFVVVAPVQEILGRGFKSLGT